MKLKFKLFLCDSFLIYASIFLLCFELFCSFPTKPDFIPDRRHVLKSDFLGRILRSRAPRRHERDRGRILVERDDAHGV